MRAFVEIKGKKMRRIEQESRRDIITVHVLWDKKKTLPEHKNVFN